MANAMPQIWVLSDSEDDNEEEPTTTVSKQPMGDANTHANRGLAEAQLMLIETNDEVGENTTDSSAKHTPPVPSSSTEEVLVFGDVVEANMLMDCGTAQTPASNAEIIRGEVQNTSAVAGDMSKQRDVAEVTAAEKSGNAEDEDEDSADSDVPKVEVKKVEPLMSPTSIPKALLRTLNSALKPTEFSTQAVWKDALNPGLAIDGINIGFPLSEHDIATIKKAGKQHSIPPSDEQDIGDIDPIQNIWEVPGDLVQIKNIAWHQQLAPHLDAISEKLGIEQSKKGMTTKLDCLIMYGSGSKIPLHKIPSKSPENFGTLDITLPSEYQGSEVELRHDGMKTGGCNSLASQYESSYVAWFLNVSTLVPVLQSGYRLVLRYCLEHKVLGEVCSAGVLGIDTASLLNVFRSWRLQNNAVCGTALGYMLKDKASKKGHANSKLSHKSLIMATQLEKLCKETGFYLCIGDLKRTSTIEMMEDEDWHPNQYTGYDGMGDKVESEEIEGKVSNIRDLDGSEPYKGFNFVIPEDCLITDYDNETPDNETEDSEGGGTKTWRRKILLIMPKTRRLVFFLGDELEETLINILTHFCQNSEIEIAKPQKCDEIKQICETVFDKVQLTATTDLINKLYSLTIQSIVLLDDKFLFARGVHLAIGTAEGTMGIKSMEQRHGIDWLQTVIGDRLSRDMNFGQRIELIADVRAILHNDEWAEKQLRSALRSTSRLNTVADGVHLCQLTTMSASNPRTLKLILRIVKDNFQFIDMIGNYLRDILQSQTIPASFIKDLLAEVTKQVTLRSTFKTTKGRRMMTAESAKMRAIIPQDIFLAALQCCHRLGLAEELDALVQKIVNDSQASTNEELKQICVPFLVKVAAAMASTGALHQTQLQRLYRGVINSTILTCVKGSRPVQPQDWSRPLRSCQKSTCPTCPSLNMFLSNPNSATFSFRYPPILFQHIKDQLKQDIKDGSMDASVRKQDPNCLIVSKKTTSYDRMLGAWKRSNQPLRKLISDIGDSNLTQLFGADIEAIKSLKQIPEPGINEPQVIDLTGNEYQHSRSALGLNPPFFPQAKPSIPGPGSNSFANQGLLYGMHNQERNVFDSSSAVPAPFKANNVSHVPPNLKRTSDLATTHFSTPSAAQENLKRLKTDAMSPYIPMPAPSAAYQSPYRSPLGAIPAPRPPQSGQPDH